MMIVALFGPSETTHAQQSGSQWYKGFQFDSTFRVGADDYSLVDQAYLKD